MTKYLFYTSLLSILFFACEKAFKKDYRDKYTGTYHFSYKYTHWSISDTVSNEPVFGTYTGTVFYDEGDEPDIIRIHFKEDHTAQFSISKDGIISRCGSQGQFTTKDHIELSYTSSCPGGAMGGGFGYSIKGDRF